MGILRKELHMMKEQNCFRLNWKQLGREKGKQVWVYLALQPEITMLSLYL